MKVLIFGSEGNMGKAVQWAARELFGVDNVETCDVVGEDKDNHTWIEPSSFNREMLGYTLDDVKPNLVLSCLPYHKNLELATACIERKIRYADLGGSVPVSDAINRLAVEKNSTVFTDLGLAPGLVNILAQQLVVQYRPTNVTMMCGGLPANPEQYPLNYFCNWSIDGLINEYKDDCLVLENSQDVVVPGMSRKQRVVSQCFSELEAFCTSGGMAHSLSYFKRNGVQNAYYKTLRFKGHVDAIQKLSKEELEVLVKPKTSKDDDIVLIRIEASDAHHLDKITRELQITHSKRFSAMQRATAFSMVAAVNNDSYSPYLNRPRLYENIDLSGFLNQFNYLLLKDTQTAL